MMDQYINKMTSKLEKSGGRVQAEKTKDGYRVTIRNNHVIVINFTIYSSGYSGRKIEDTFDIDFVVTIGNESFFYRFSEEPLRQLQSDFDDIYGLARSIMANKYKFKQRKVLRFFKQRVLAVNAGGNEFELPLTNKV